MREATRARHEVLDAAMPLAREGAGVLGYRDHLRLLAAWLAPLEEWLARFDDGPQGGREGDGVVGSHAPPPLARLPLIEADLAQIAPADDALVMPLVAHARDWPAPQSGVATPAFRFGVCYVIEGSQLGGAVLLRRLAPVLAPHPLRYLQGAMDRVVPPGPRWQLFLKALEEQVQGEEAVAQCVAGACAAFDRLLELLRANPHLAAPARKEAA